MSQSGRLSIVLGLNLALVAGLTVAGLAVGSVSLLATAGDCVGDVVALGLGLLAVHLRDRHGRAGATNVVASVNVVVLLAVSVGVLIEASVRLLQGAPEVPGVPVVLGGVVTAVVLGGGVLVLGRGAGREDLHMRSVLLDTASDSAAAGAVALAGAVMAVTHGLYWLDPAVGAVIALVVMVGAVRLLVDVGRALRRGTAVQVDLD
ncbi:cation transporter [Amnibacterium sp.]|uniref:cation transporter n=1 Tax=Amnibacterium sp. TaxID=1872496 RepID=UPI00260E64BB|nr:cation transporter [Amnibacterium sp.]MCU1474136.1 cation transporter [Amnibacterium sp.]